MQVFSLAHAADNSSCRLSVGRFIDRSQLVISALYVRHRAGRSQVRVVEFNESTSFRQQLEEVSSAGLFVSVHTSNLANAQFMRPGSAVLEVIQRNWAHHDLDKSFQARHRRPSSTAGSLPGQGKDAAAALPKPPIPVYSDKGLRYQ